MSADERRVVAAAIASMGPLPAIPERRLGSDGVLRLLAIATTMAVLRRFEALPDDEAVAAYGSALRERFPEGAHLIDDAALTAIVRSAHGHADGAADPAAVRLLLRLLPFALLSEETDPDPESFVDDVIAASAQREPA